MDKSPRFPGHKVSFQEQLLKDIKAPGIKLPGMSLAINLIQIIFSHSLKQ